jgi:Tfp pilus assembly protein PilF
LGKNQRKPVHKRVAIIIVALVAISMIAPSFMLLYSSNNNSNAVYSSGANSSTQGLQSQINSLSTAVKSNPQDIPSRLNLANAYYDLAMITMGGNSPEKAVSIFKQAIFEYQEVSKTQKDINILVDLATAAFYAGEDELADKTFKEALVLKPDFLNALSNYGIFLMNAKGDYMGAIAQWKKALEIANPSPADSERLKNLIGMAQTKIQESFEKSGTINNPNISTPGAK